MGFGSEWFNQLPQIIQDGKTIQLIPIFFSVGINELQSYAETIAGKKASELQVIFSPPSPSLLTSPRPGHHQFREFGKDGEVLQSRGCLREWRF
jgi:hypothetical protein